MGCASNKHVRDQKDQKDQQKRNKPEAKEATSGYTIHEFVRDHLLPVEGFIYTKHYYEKKDSKQAGSQRHHFEDVGKVCYCIITSTEINTDTSAAAKIDKAFDFNQDSSLPIVVNGFLYFPPEKPIEEKAAKGKEVQEGAKDSSKVKLKVGVMAKLSKSDVDIDAGDLRRGGDDLKISCTGLDIPRTEDKEGDAMIDSWLPADEVLHGIERMLEAKLKDALRGQGG
mmetsp:Transcript_26389/g.60851  ORF Transcript_26389/g.60851 Transcript_26389/m.60851 type:complete len:226 (+) Transcript_26389:36-713(+)